MGALSKGVVCHARDIHLGLGRRLSYRLTTTADGRTIMHSRLDSSTADLVVVDNLR